MFVTNYTYYKIIKDWITPFSLISLISLFSLIFLFSACKSSEDNTPEISCNDCNFSSVLNNEEFKSNAMAKIINKWLIIEAKEYKNSYKTITIRLLYDSLLVKTYFFNDFVNAEYNGYLFAQASYMNEEMKYFTTDTSSKTTDKITITKLDKSKRIISGIFNFTGKDATFNKSIFSNGNFNELSW